LGRRPTRTTSLVRPVVLAVILGLGGGCARQSDNGARADVAGSSALKHVFVDYNFDSLDERPVSSAALRGKTTVVAFVTTFDLERQAQVDYLAAMARNDGDRVNYALVALERPESRELVEGFRNFVKEKFGVSFATALGDAATIAGGGPFGDVHVVPTTVILDRQGKLAWKHRGLSKAEEIRAAMRHVEGG
jgi:hypothetical protein